MSGGNIEISGNATLNVTATVAQAYAIYTYNGAKVKTFGGIITVSDEATNTRLTNGNVLEWDVNEYGKLFVTGRFV